MACPTTAGLVVLYALAVPFALPGARQSFHPVKLT